MSDRTVTINGHALTYVADVQARFLALKAAFEKIGVKKNFANYMYMHTANGRDAFKCRDTRAYVFLKNTSDGPLLQLRELRQFSSQSDIIAIANSNDVKVIIE